MKVEHHIAFSAAVSGSLYAAGGSWQMAVAAFVTGFAIDCDHCGDYLVEFGVRSNWRNFFRSFYEGYYTRIYIPFHSWELLFLLGVVAYLSEWNQWVVGVLLGAVQHMIVDQFSNGAAGLGYSFLWRWFGGFEPNRSFPYRRTPFVGPRGAAVKIPVNPKMNDDVP